MNRNASITALIAALVLAGPAGAQTILHVDINAPTSGLGTSWADAITSITPALEIAEPGDQVWVARGTYHDRIALPAGVELYGGFRGSEASPGERPAFPRPVPDPDATILDAAGGGTVVTATAAGNGTRLDGFTITGGHAPRGGGILLDSSTVAIVNNTITGNTATEWGGGMYARLARGEFARNQVLENAAAENGGGIYLLGSYPVITGNRFHANTAGHRGGGLYINLSSPPITNNIIAANTAADKGGGLYLTVSASDIVNNTVAANSAGETGGAMYMNYSWPAMANTIMALNSSGIHAENTKAPRLPSFRYNLVYHPEADDYTGIDDPKDNHGNISADPFFVRLPAPGDAGDLRLQSGSPGIDTGDTAALPPGIATDFAGNPRIFDGTEDGIAIVDMGAYEFVYHQTVTFLTDGTDGAFILGDTEQILLRGTDTSAVTAIPPLGSEFVRWTDNGEEYSTANPITIANVARDITLTANFAQLPPPFVFNFTEHEQHPESNLAWTFHVPPEYEGGVEGFHDEAGRRLAATTTRNDMAFGFWESPVFETATEPPAAQRGLYIPGEAGNDGLFLATWDIAAGAETPRTALPSIRLRASAFNFATTDELMMSSVGRGELMPTPESLRYHQLFSLPAADNRFRLDFDVLSFDARNAEAAEFYLERAAIEYIGVPQITSGMPGVPVLSYDFTNEEDHGFTPRHGGPALAPPQHFEVTDRGLAITPAIEPPETPTIIFGFWGKETAETIKGNALYRAVYTIGSDAAPEDRLAVPAFRARLNDLSMQWASLLHVASFDNTTRVPVQGNSQTYSTWFITPHEIDGHRWVLSFDVIYVPGMDPPGDPQITLFLERIELFEYTPGSV